VESELNRRLSWVAALAVALAAQGAAAQQKSPKNPPAAAPAPAAPAAAPAATETSANPEKEAAGKLAAAGWLTLLDRRDWGRAWETSSSVFRNTVPLGAWMDAIPKVREPFGPLVERAPLRSMYKTQLQGRPDGEYVTVVFVSKFGEREVEEIVTTVRDEDGKWRVTGYTAR
jgi:hypothetical protein